jgi:CCR4-NOT transcription complex subunit 1
MEVFTKYFRRVLQNNAAQVFGSGGRITDPNGSYQILVTEVQKLRTDPEQADKIAESLSSSEGDLFRDFDLAGFVSHFQLDPLSLAMLTLACRRTDLRSKGELASVTCRRCMLTLLSS